MNETIKEKDYRFINDVIIKTMEIFLSYMK